MNKDTYPDIGPKTRHLSFEDCLVEVRIQYPNAYAEGSTGSERSFWVNKEMVAHMWPVRNSNDMWLRIKSSK